ncbi:MAG: hypothetical protein MMC33_000974 [Icmadophila ericetorum]|nr:hypothetical protein [Icmadophila ericetorum]
MSSSSRRKNTRSHTTDRPSDDADLAVTQAGFASLVIDQSYPVASTLYQNTGLQYQHQHPYPGPEPSSSYIPSPYDPASYAVSSPGGFDGSAQLYQSSQLVPGAELYGTGQAPSIPSDLSPSDMSYGGYMAMSPGQRFDPTLQNTYYDSQSRSMSMSNLYGPNFAGSLAFGPSGIEDRQEVARQLQIRRASHGVRRERKLRVRKRQLPSTVDARPGSNMQVMGGSVDLSSFAAPSIPTSYVDTPDDRYSSRSRHSFSSTHGDYGSVVPGSAAPYDRPYAPTYNTSMGPVNPSIYGPQQVPTQVPPSLIYPPYTGDRRSPNPRPSLSPHPESSSQQRPISPKIIDQRREKPQCFEHGCNGREFSTFSNLLRHQREKSGTAAKSYCPHCGAEFTRTTARNGHMEHGKCKPRRTSDDR